MKLIVNVGGMFSGKTTALIQQGERYILAKKRVAYVKPQTDNRYSKDSIVTHKGQEVKAIIMPINRITSEAFNYDVILIDEVQFFEKSICRDIEDLIGVGKTIIVAGLDMDSNGDPFETVMILMAKADEVIKHKSVCEICALDAGLSYRKVKSSKKILLGEKESYIPLCRRCFLEVKKNGLRDHFTDK